MISGLAFLTPAGLESAATWRSYVAYGLVVTQRRARDHAICAHATHSSDVCSAALGLGCGAAPPGRRGRRRERRPRQPDGGRRLDRGRRAGLPSPDNERRALCRRRGGRAASPCVSRRRRDRRAHQSLPPIRMVRSAKAASSMAASPVPAWLPVPARRWLRAAAVYGAGYRPIECGSGTASWKVHPKALPPGHASIESHVRQLRFLQQP